MNKNILHQIIRQIKYLKRENDGFRITKFWIFIDDNRIKLIERLIKRLPTGYIFGLIIRGKNKKQIYHRAKKLGKICKYRRIPFYVSTYPMIALSVGANGVHYPKNIRYVRPYNNLETSCSLHELNETRRVIRISPNRAFLSPIFKTTSSKIKKPVSLHLINVYFRRLKCKNAVLGGIDLKNLKILRNRNISAVGGLSLLFKIFE